MAKFKRIVLIIGAAAMLLAMVEPLRLASDWWELRGYLAEMEGLVPMSSGSAEAFDWVVWDDGEGQIEARYVFPTGPAAEGGLQAGDTFYMLDNIQYFTIQDLRDAVRGAGPGKIKSYLVERDGAYHEVDVRFTRFPTFLYPRSEILWQFALWGFAIGAFFHFLALSIAAPLARQSEQARTEFILIAVSALWIVANLARLFSVEMLGPPVVGSTYDKVFQGLTLLGLVGWIGFPILLLDEVMCGILDRPPSWMRSMLPVPPVMFGIAIAAITFAGHLGPITLESLLVPILVYASCYIGASALAVMVVLRSPPGDDEEAEQQRSYGGWGLIGSMVIFGAALAAALSVQEVVPLLDRLGPVAAGWLIVSAQLLAVAPVTMLSYGTLRHGKVDDVLSRTMVYAMVLGLIFFVVVAGFSLLDQYLGGPSYVLSGLFVIVLLLVFDRIIRRVRGLADAVFRTERQRARQLLIEQQERMPDVLDADELLLDVVSAAGAGLGARSAILFVQFSEPEPRWRSASYHPEPPYLTERVFQAIWPHFESDSRVWARNPELDTRGLPAAVGRELLERGAALAVPIRAKGTSRGLLVLGTKQSRRAVYNLEDVDVLRGLAAHLAVAADRLDLVERERHLARETTEAQLVALRSQINPHFLFNALNTILSNISEKPETAETAVENLAAIFRYTLNAGKLAFVTLRQEFELVGHYLDIEQARFGENLEVRTSIEEGLEQTLVPAFCVQTLVENAVKHGIERRRGGGLLVVEATSTPDGAAVRVSDTGVGIPALFGAAAPTTSLESFYGIGLRNVHARMELLYGRSDLLEMQSDPETGTVATLRLPSTVDAGANGDQRPVSNEPIAT